jgi:DUF2950 family protein
MTMHSRRLGAIGGPVWAIMLALSGAWWSVTGMAQTHREVATEDRGYGEGGGLQSHGVDLSAFSDASPAATNDISSAASRGRAAASSVPMAATEPSARKPETFASPEAATKAFIEALNGNDSARLEAIFVDTRLISSGDEIADRGERARFLREYNRKHSLGGRDQAMVTLYVGESAWPFAVPIVKGKDGYYFDSAAGAREVLFRRIGRNEIRAIATCSGFVAAQKEYASVGHDGGPAGLYAQKLMSDPGKRNGLFWPAKAGDLRSPAGPALADAEAAGYDAATAAKTTPYYGYLFRTLTAQGEGARDGARNYIDAEGKQAAGFALVAYPSEYGRSGVKTFIVNQDGIVYEKDLGARTSETVREMHEFDPEGWKVAQ